MAAAAAPVPRPAPDFVFVDGSGQRLPLSAWRGKVVAVNFILTTCPHCQQTCQKLEALYQEWKALGFQPVAMAFNPMASLLVDEFKRDFKVTFPVCHGGREAVNTFMGFAGDRMLLVPQLALVDRKGRIRFQTPEDSSAELSDEKALRARIQPLLTERP